MKMSVDRKFRFEEESADKKFDCEKAFKALKFGA